MKRTIYIIVCIILLAGCATLCALRWQVWTAQLVAPQRQDVEALAVWHSLPDSTLSAWCQPGEDWQNGPMVTNSRSHFIDTDSLRLIVVDTHRLHRLSQYTRTAGWLRRVIGSAGNRKTIVVMQRPANANSTPRPGERLLLGMPLREADLVVSRSDTDTPQD